MAQVPNAADDAYPAQPAFLGETGQDVPEGTLATTETPTTTGTASGEFYRLGSPGRAFAHAVQTGEPMSGQDLQTGIEASTLLGLPTMKMEDALRGLGAEEASGFRRALRVMTRSANRAPDAGPQAMSERTAAVQAAADVPSARNKLLHRVADLSTQDVQNAIDRYDIDPMERAEKQITPTEDEKASLYRALLKTRARSKLPATGPHGEPPLESPTPRRKGLGAMFKDRPRSTAEGHVTPGRVEEVLKDFRTRRAYQDLGWEPKDLKGMSDHNLREILNRNIKNTPGLADRWSRNDAAKQWLAAEQTRTSKALDEEAKKVGQHLDFVDFLKQRGGLEESRYPLMSSEQLDPTKHSASWAVQQLKKPGGPMYRPPENPWPPKR